MRKHLFYSLAFITALTIGESCGSSSRLYRKDDKDKIYSGQLSDPIITSLKRYLTNTTNVELKDTIIIRYDYNNETCWNLLDQSADEEIRGFVTRQQERIQRVSAARKNVSIFKFREPGNNLNKKIKWDNSIIVDSSKELFSLLFKRRSTCGNSIIIMPDKRYIFLRSDSHSEILDLTQEQMEQILAKK